MAIDKKGKRFAAKIPTGIPAHLAASPNKALKAALQRAERREGNANKGSKRKRSRPARTTTAKVAKVAAKGSAPASSEPAK